MSSISPLTTHSLTLTHSLNHSIGRGSLFNGTFFGYYLFIYSLVDFKKLFFFSSSLSNININILFPVSTISCANNNQSIYSLTPRFCLWVVCSSARSLSLSIMKSVLFVVLIAASSIAIASAGTKPLHPRNASASLPQETCGGNCPSNDCNSCPCGTATAYENIAAMCSLYSDWSQECCQCIVSHESSGNAHAVNHNENGSNDVGVWQINDTNWPSCSNGEAPCDPNTASSFISSFFVLRSTFLTTSVLCFVCCVLFMLPYIECQLCTHG